MVAQLNKERKHRKYFADNCLSRISLNEEPIDFKKLSKCKQDDKCYKQVEATPSVSYALSHR